MVICRMGKDDSIIVTGLGYDIFIFYKQSQNMHHENSEKGSLTIRNGFHPKSVSKHILTLQVQTALQCPQHFPHHP